MYTDFFSINASSHMHNLHSPRNESKFLINEDIVELFLIKKP